ncbi:MAG: molybdopterin-dependent oxidoreductase, partial [Coriobacteriales bacterium]
MSRDQFIFPKDPSPDVSYLDDGTKVVRACAWSPPGCHSTGCGVKMFIKDGKLVKVEGDPEHPLSRGRLCPRCLAMVEYVYHPDRILYPMKRAREDRGKDKFERISWDEATDIIVSETKRIQQEYGYESVVTYMGTGREAVTYGFIFSSQVLGTPNTCYAQSGWSCMGPRMTAMSMLFGSQYLELDFGGAYEGMWDNPDFTPPEYVFMLGKEPLKSNPDGLWGHSLLELMKTRGTKLINVDPRVSWIGSRADYFLQVKPNSDGALVMALLNVVTQEDLVDHDFIDKWCYGYEELKARAAEYPPSFAAKECGVPEEKIIEVGRILGTKRWSMLIGVATDQNPNGCQVVQGLCDLVAITGNLDVPGGTVMGLNMEFDMDMTTAVPESAQGKTIGWDEYPILPVMLNTTHPDLTLEALETDKPYPLKMAWIDSTNLLSPTCSAQPKRWHDALNRMEFIVAKDTFMNPTIMALADIVLPVSTWAEHNGVVKNNNGCQMGIFGALRGEVQVGEAMGDLEMFIHFGKAFHGK